MNGHLIQEVPDQCKSKTQKTKNNNLFHAILLVEKKGPRWNRYCLKRTLVFISLSGQYHFQINQTTVCAK